MTPSIKSVKTRMAALWTVLLATLFLQPTRSNLVVRYSRKFARNNKGFSAVLVSIVVVVVASIMIMIAAIVLSKVASSIDRTGLSEAANDTLDASEAQAYGALNLLNVVLIILAAVAVIGSVVGIFAYIRMKQ